MCVGVVVAAWGSVVSADTFGTGDNQFTIDFVPISGDASTANGMNISQHNFGNDGYRAFTDPASNYRMGVHEITNDQWEKFEAALGDGDPVTGTNLPITGKTWYDAAQFVNWLNTSTDHHVAYKFSGTSMETWSAGEAAGGTNLYRHKDAVYYLPTEDEWVKAAYWNDNTTTLQMYANASPGDLISDDPDPAKWNYLPSAIFMPWEVGSGNSAELNGTFDMMGNVWEWMESPYEDIYNLTDCVLRGGAYFLDESNLASNYRFPNASGDAFPAIPILGFRVASVPEPCSLGLLALGGLALIKRKRR